MKIPKYARYDLCIQKACEFLEEYNISSYPINVEQIIFKNHWGLTPYSILMKKFNCDRQTVIECLRSKDGYTQLDNDNYSIAYNDDPLLGDRKRFTLMHEIGHIYLNHLIDFDITLLHRGELSQEENKVLENEANAFARNVLVPVSLIQGLKDKAPENISAKFGISYYAANTRLDFYRKDYELTASIGLLQRMRNIYGKFYNKTTCTKCCSKFSLRYRKFCPICGSKNTLKRGDGTMNYKEHEINDQGFVKVCIRCENQEIVGNYCHICGSPTRNYCTDISLPFPSCNHSEPLPGNARYCPDCGAESLFYQKGLLADWETEKNSDTNQNIESKPKTRAKQLFTLDDELPFN